MIGTCEYCHLKTEVKEYDLEDGDTIIGCVDEDSCQKQMMYNEWGEE